MEYGRNLLSIGLFYLEFSDAIKEGDGERVLRCWRYLLPIFKGSCRKNYSVEVLNMLCQFHYDLPPRLSQELIWSRFVSTHSLPGRNIPEDLHQEHLNRVVKDFIRGLGANKTEDAIMRIGKALGTLFPVIENFDEENNVYNPAGAHKPPSSSKDQDLIIENLLKCNLFSSHPHRCYPSFSEPKNLFLFSNQSLLNWMAIHL